MSKSWLSGQMSDSFLLYHNTTGFALHGIVLAGCSTASVGETTSHYKKYLHKANAALPTFPGWRGFILSCFGFSLWILERNMQSDFSAGRTSKHVCYQKRSLGSCRLIQVVPGVALTRIAMVSFWKDVPQWRIQNLHGGNREIPKSCGYLLLWVLESAYTNTAI